MKFKILGLFAAVLTLSAAPALAGGKLNVYNWGDYINPEVLDRFADEFGVDVSLDTYSSNEEMLAKIQAGATGYDIIFPSVHMQDIMMNLGLLKKNRYQPAPRLQEHRSRFAFRQDRPERGILPALRMGNGRDRLQQDYRPRSFLVG